MLSGMTTSSALCVKNIYIRCSLSIETLLSFYNVNATLRIYFIMFIYVHE